MKLVIKRFRELEDRTLGMLYVLDDKGESILNLATLELPWRNNWKEISCIPAGTYFVSPRRSPKYGKHLIVEGVKNRSYVLFHAGNFPSQTRGCIIVGMCHGDADADGIRDVMRSREAMAQLTALVTKRSELVIEDQNPWV